MESIDKPLGIREAITNVNQVKSYHQNYHDAFQVVKFVYTLVYETNIHAFLNSLHHPFLPVQYIHSLRGFLRQTATLEVVDMIVSDSLILHWT